MARNVLPAEAVPNRAEIPGRSIALLLLTTLACGGPRAVPSDGGVADGGRLGDGDGGTVLADGGAGLARGEVVLASEASALRLRLYLPEGSGPGRRYFVDDDLVWEGQPLVREGGTFDGAGHAELSCVHGCTAVLDAATGCATITAEGGANYNPRGGDIYTSIPARSELCPIEDPPEARLASIAPHDVAGVAPLGTLALRARVPLDETTIASVRLTRDGTDLPLRYEGGAFGGRLVVEPAVDPEGALAIDASGLRDVFGNEIETSVSVLATSDVISDLSLESAPPSGAIAHHGASLDASSGPIRATDAGRWPRERPFVALLALGDPGAAGAVRIEGWQAQRYGLGVTARVVRSGGATSEALALPVRVSSTDPAATIDVPIPAGSGAIWVVLHSAQEIPQPWDIAPATFVGIDSLAMLDP